ncbi:MAG: DUF2493 domain-containing protein [Sphaerochaetaceae bacterium]
MNLLIAGGRDFNDHALMVQALQELQEKGIIDDSVELICGMAKGADMLGYSIFSQLGLPTHKFIPDWNGLGKRAGFVRNEEMGKACCLALIFWDGKSRGTKHMISYLDMLAKPYFLVNY